MRITAQDVHMAWRDGMLEQGRRVPARRQQWATLSAKDRVLDQKIAQRLNEIAERPEVCPGCRHTLPDEHREISEGTAWCVADMDAASAAGDDPRSVGPCY